MSDRTRRWDQTQEAADYRREYNKAHYDEFKIRCQKGTISIIDSAAKQEGMSRTAFVMLAVKEKIEQQNKKHPVN